LTRLPSSPSDVLLLCLQRNEQLVRTRSFSLSSPSSVLRLITSSCFVSTDRKKESKESGADTGGEMEGVDDGAEEEEEEEDL